MVDESQQHAFESASRTPRAEHRIDAAPAGAIEFLDADDAIHVELERDLRDASVLERYGAMRLQMLRPTVPQILWPQSWYIPGQADYRQHWFLEPPLDHRYAWEGQNTIGGAPAASRASAATGELFAWSNASGLDVATVGVARTGAYVRPTTTLATYELSASVDLATEWRWWFEPGSNASSSSSFAYRSTVYVVAWLVSPADGSWELLRPFGSRTLVSERVSGFGRFDIRTARHAFDDLRVRVQLEGHRTYAVGVSFETQVTPTAVDRNGKPYRPQPGDDIRTWSSMIGRVPKVVARRVITHIA